MKILSRKTQLFLLLAVGILLIFAGSVQAAPKKAKTELVLVLVDKSAYKELREGLGAYFADVKKLFNVKFKVMVKDYYNELKPPEIRRMLREEYSRNELPVVGAIMVGPIPIALKREANKALYPKNLYYEDFDAKWTGPEGAKGIFTKVQTNPKTNATEIWTAWWVPPSNDRAEQVKMLQGFLKKLHAFYQGKLTGTDSMLFLSSGRWCGVEACESWTVLMGGVINSSGQKFILYCGNPEFIEPHEKPAKGEVFTTKELMDLLTKRRWQHMHIQTHGAPGGFYWKGGNKIEAKTIDLTKFDKTGPNFLTMSGCNNGTIRGTHSEKPDYTNSIANTILFSPRTATVAFFGNGSEQSTGAFAAYFTQLFEAVDVINGSYYGEGFFKMRNFDHPWGTLHYMFRWADEKVLGGDPFYRYRASKKTAATKGK